MISTVKKCAIKRTAKKAGVWALGIGLGITALLAVATGFAFVLDNFPLLDTIVRVMAFVMVVVVFVGMPVIATYDEYKWNVRNCEDEALMVGEDKL